MQQQTGGAGGGGGPDEGGTQQAPQQQQQQQQQPAHTQPLLGPGCADQPSDLTEGMALTGKAATASQREGVQEGKAFAGQDEGAKLLLCALPGCIELQQEQLEAQEQAQQPPHASIMLLLLLHNGNPRGYLPATAPVGSDAAKEAATTASYLPSPSPSAAPTSPEVSICVFVLLSPYVLAYFCIK